MEREVPIRHQCKLFAVGVVDGVDFGKITYLMAYIHRKIRRRDGFYIDDVLADFVEIEFRIHVLPFLDLDGLDHTIRHSACQIDMQQTVFHHRLADIDTIGQHE